MQYLAVDHVEGQKELAFGIGIWKLPLAKDEAHAKWREEWLSKIKKTKGIDQNCRELIKHDRVYTCEKHFAPEDIEICK